MIGNIFSFGGGVQSIAILYLIKNGVIKKPDMIVHANLSSFESYLAYDFKTKIMPLIASVGADYKEIETGNAMLNRLHNGDVVTPFWFKTETGHVSLQKRRYCTTDYKIKPLNKLIPKMSWVKIWLGISNDELKRASTETHFLSRGRVRENYYPLVDLDMSRGDCIAYIESNGYKNPQKSACDICPFSSKSRLLGRLAVDDTLYSRIKYIESCWHKNPKNRHKFLTSYLDELPTPDQAVRMFSPALVDNSGNCGVCEF